MSQENEEEEGEKGSESFEGRFADGAWYDIRLIAPHDKYNCFWCQNRVVDEGNEEEKEWIASDLIRRGSEPLSALPAVGSKVIALHKDERGELWFEGTVKKVQKEHGRATISFHDGPMKGEQHVYSVDDLCSVSKEPVTLQDLEQACEQENPEEGAPEIVSFEAGEFVEIETDNEHKFWVAQVLESYMVPVLDTIEDIDDKAAPKIKIRWMYRPEELSQSVKQRRDYDKDHEVLLSSHTDEYDKRFLVKKLSITFFDEAPPQSIQWGHGEFFCWRHWDTKKEEVRPLQYSGFSKALKEDIAELLNNTPSKNYTSEKYSGVKRARKSIAGTSEKTNTQGGKASGTSDKEQSLKKSKIDKARESEAGRATPKPDGEVQDKRNKSDIGSNGNTDEKSDVGRRSISVRKESGVRSKEIDVGSRSNFGSKKDVGRKESDIGSKSDVENKESDVESRGPESQTPTHKDGEADELSTSAPMNTQEDKEEAEVASGKMRKSVNGKEDVPQESKGILSSELKQKGSKEGVTNAHQLTPKPRMGISLGSKVENEGQWLSERRSAVPDERAVDFFVEEAASHVTGGNFDLQAIAYMLHPKKDDEDARGIASVGISQGFNNEDVWDQCVKFLRDYAKDNKAIAAIVVVEKHVILHPKICELWPPEEKWKSQDGIFLQLESAYRNGLWFIRPDAATNEEKFTELEMDSLSRLIPNILPDLSGSAMLAED